MGLRGGAAWCGAGAQQCGAAQGRNSVGRRRGAAVWGGAGAQQRGAAQGRSAGPRMGAASGRGGVQQRGAARGRSAGLRRGAPWGCAGAHRGAAQGRSSVGPRRGAARGCAGAQQRGAAQGSSSVGGRWGHGVHVGGGGGGLWAAGWARARGGRWCGELSRRASPCGRPGRGAAGAGQSRPGSPGRSRCRGGPRSAVGPAPRSAGTNPAEHHLGVTSCPPSRTPYTRDLTIFYISTLSMLFDVCDQSCWQSCVTPVEIRVDVLALCIPVF